MAYDKQGRARHWNYNVLRLAAGAGATTLKPYQTTVLMTAPTSGNTVITLPNVAECAGMIFTINCIDGVGTCSVAGDGTELNAYASGSITAGGRASVYSDGINWHAIGFSAT